MSGGPSSRGVPRAFRYGLRTVAVAMIVQALAGQAADAQLTLGEALDRASTHSPDYRSALADMRLAGPSGKQAWGAFLPSLSFSFGTAGSFSRTARAENFFGETVEPEVVETRPSYSSGLSLNTSVTLFSGGSRFADLRATRAQATSRGRAAAAELVQVRAEVERAFYGAQQQEELLNTEEEILAGRIRDLEATERLFRIATRSRADVLAAELEVQRQERQVEFVLSERDKSLLALKRVIGDPDLTDVTIQPGSIRMEDPSRLDEEALVSAAVESNPNVSRGVADVDASLAALSGQRARRWPTLTLDGGVSRGSQRSDPNALFNVNPDDNTSGRLSLGVSIPIFQQFQTSYQIASAEVDLARAEEAHRRIRLETEERVRAGLIDLRNAFRTVQINVGALEVAEERLRLVREEYRLAVKSIEDLLDAVDAAATARRDVVSSRYDYVTARIALEEAIGLPLTEVAGGAGT